ncbi:putative transposase [Colletotrichum incanum]|uniref:Putative transposase n=1 Tax=Colletotrichum incanum TaxID=1573173 RepID=A0A161VZD8_COLIC|nr:putative transposase [Colletotrichum incanum]
MPRPCDKNMTAAKKAAEVVFAAQQRAQFDRAGKQISTISIREVARQYGVSDMSIRRHLRTLRAGHSLRASPPAALGRPRALTVAEDAALAAFVIWLAEAGFPALPIQVEETANYLRNLCEL